MLIGPLGINVNEILIKIHSFSFMKVAFENGVGKMASILSGAWCVNINLLFSFSDRMEHDHYGRAVTRQPRRNDMPYSDYDSRDRR